MALEATHVRFALDLAKKYGVLDIQKYLAGTVYPDSRYATSLERKITHPDQVLNSGFTQPDDFIKGWAVHLLCDKIQAEITKEQLPELFELEMGQGKPQWIHRTALKILQDIQDASHDIIGYLPLLDYAETPKGEDRDAVLRYNHDLQEIYKHPADMGIHSYTRMWRLFGLTEELEKKVVDQADKYRQDKKATDFIDSVYGLMLARANE